LLFTEDEVAMLLGDDVYVGIYSYAHTTLTLTEKRYLKILRIVIPAPYTLVPTEEAIFRAANVEILDLATQNSTIVYQSPKSLQLRTGCLMAKTCFTTVTDCFTNLI